RQTFRIQRLRRNLLAALGDAGYDTVVEILLPRAPYHSWKFDSSGVFRLPDACGFLGRPVMWRFSLLLGCLLALTGLALRAADKPPEPANAKLPDAAPGTIDFQRDIKPILAKSCISCHGPAKQKSGLRLDDRAEALKGGNSGPVIKPGDPVHSRLLLLVAGLDPELRMPPQGKQPLTKEEVAKLRAWIEQGAK